MEPVSPSNEAFPAYRAILEMKELRDYCEKANAEAQHL